MSDEGLSLMEAGRKAWDFLSNWNVLNIWNFIAEVKPRHRSLGPRSRTGTRHARTTSRQRISLKRTNDLSRQLLRTSKLRNVKRIWTREFQSSWMDWKCGTHAPASKHLHGGKGIRERCCDIPTESQQTRLGCWNIQENQRLLSGPWNVWSGCRLSRKGSQVRDSSNATQDSYSISETSRAMESVSIETSLAYYDEALSLIESEDRPRAGVDVFKRAISFATKSRRCDKHISFHLSCLMRVLA